MEYFLKKISVDRYKNLADCSIEMQNVTVLAGPNNCGKSNLLELFTVLEQIFFGGDHGREKACSIIGEFYEPIQVGLEFEVNRDGKTFKAEYTIQFSAKKAGSAMDIFIGHESLFFKYVSTTGKANRLFLREGDSLNLREKSGKFKEHPIRPQLPVINVIKALYPKPDDLPDDFLYLIPLLYYISPPVIALTPEVGGFEQQLEDILKRLNTLQVQNDQRYQAFASLFGRLMGMQDVKVQELATPFAGPADKFYACTMKENAGGAVKNLDKLSENTKRLFMLLFHLVIETERLICVEEIEAGLHPQVLQRLLPLFMNRMVPAQALVTSHSPFLLDLVEAENVYVARRTAAGQTSFVNVASIKDVTKKLRNKHTSLGGLFLKDFRVQ